MPDENGCARLTESRFCPNALPFHFTTDKNLPFVEYAGEKNFSVLAAGAGFSSGDFQNLARR